LWFEWYWKMCCHHNIVIALLYIALGDIHDNHNCVWSCNLKAWFNFIQLFTFPQVDVDIEVESTESFPISEEIRIKAQSLRFITLLTIFIEVVRFCSLYYGSSCFLWHIEIVLQMVKLKIIIISYDALIWTFQQIFFCFFCLLLFLTNISLLQGTRT